MIELYGRVFSCWYSPGSGLQIQRLSQSSTVPPVLPEREVFTVGNPHAQIWEGDEISLCAGYGKNVQVNTGYSPSVTFAYSTSHYQPSPSCVPPAASASMTNTKLQPLLSLFPQPETQMCVQNWRKSLKKFAETVEFRRKTYWISPRLVSLPLSGSLFLRSLCYWLGKQEKVTPAIGPLCPTLENHLVSCWEIRGWWLTVLCSASTDHCLQARGSPGAQSSRWVMSERVWGDPDDTALHDQWRLMPKVYNKDIWWGILWDELEIWSWGLWFMRHSFMSFRADDVTTERKKQLCAPHRITEWMSCCSEGLRNWYCPKIIKI